MTLTATIAAFFSHAARCTVLIFSVLPSGFVEQQTPFSTSEFRRPETEGSFGGVAPAAQLELTSDWLCHRHHIDPHIYYTSLPFGTPNQGTNRRNSREMSSFVDRYLVVVVIFFLIIRSESFKTWTQIRSQRQPSFLNQLSIDINKLFEGDMIVLEEANGRPRSLAAVTANKMSLQPLCVRSSSGVEELAEGSIHDIILYEDEECEPIAMDTVIMQAGAVVEDVVFTQRCVEDRVTNPHGEHAEGRYIPFFSL